MQPRLFRALPLAFATSASVGLVTIVLTLLVVGWTLKHNLRVIDGLVEQIIEVEEPTGAAAYEMEINVLGVGFGVWNYLTTGDPQHRERVHNDEADFRRFRAEYGRLALTARENELGEQIDALFGPFFRLGHALMDTRDECHSALAQVTDALAEMDQILDDRLQSQLDPETRDGAAKLAESTAVEADVAEVGSWIAAYVSAPTIRNRERITESLDEARERLTAFRALQITSDEHDYAAALKRLLDQTAACAAQAVTLHDSLRQGEKEFIAIRRRLDDTLDEGIQVLAQRELGGMQPKAKAAIERLYRVNLIVLALGAVVCVGAAALVTHRSTQLSSANRDLHLEIERRQQSEADRGRLVQDLMSAQEDERGRLARDLHDQLGQNLSTLMLGLKRLSQPAAGQSRSPAPASQLKQLQLLTGQLIEQVHTIAWELRPVALDDVGLHGALSNYIEEWVTRSGVKVDLESDMEGERLPAVVETALYRVAQEALTNVVKHAHARQVSLTLQRRGPEVVMVVEDDGVGFVPEQVSSRSAGRRRMGVLGMKERITLAGGVLELESAPGHGTTLVVRIAVV